MRSVTEHASTLALRGDNRCCRATRMQRPAKHPRLHQPQIATSRQHGLRQLEGQIRRRDGGTGARTRAETRQDAGGSVGRLIFNYVLYVGTRKAHTFTFQIR